MVDLLLSALAADVAWTLARRLVEAQPIAAVIGLSPVVVSRRRQTFGMFAGVAAGIVVGEANHKIGLEAPWSIPAVTLAAMLAVSAIGLDAVMVIQAGASALVVASELPGTATTRLADAGIGAAVALVFSQGLFSADPERTLRQAGVIAECLSERTLRADG